MTCVPALRRRRAGLLACAAAALAGWPAPALAVAPATTGWWSRTQVALVPLRTTPTVPEGGLYVAGDPAGPSGVSALRYALSDGVASARLVLGLASVQGTAALRACPSPIAWAGEQGGPLSSAPPADCQAGAIPGVVTADQKSVVFEVGPLVRDGILNVVLLPQPGAVFQAAFAKPGDGSLQTVPAAGGSDPAGASDPAAAPDPAAGPDVLALPSTASGADGPAFAPFAPAAAGPALSDIAPQGPASAASRLIPGASLTVPQPALRRTEGPRARVAAAVLLFDLALVFLWTLRHDARPVRGIGRFARPVAGSSAPERGVGRFRRPRPDAPVRV